MKILVVGGGGREHAILWKIAQQHPDYELFAAPGNGGTQAIAENVDIGVKDVAGLVKLALEKKIDFTIVPQDDALAAGVVDVFQSNGLRAFGPTRVAAEIESEKAFAKYLMENAGVPTANFRVFTNRVDALAYIRAHGAPIVVKANGLALGKGVYVCKTIEAAEAAIDEIMVKRVHKGAGNAVVIEDFLPGPEVSIHAFCDGKNFSLWPSAQDHKPVFDGDEGLNTGGMGTIAPLPWVSKAQMQDIGETIVGPIMRELARMGRPFVGCLYPGLKMTSSGPKALEFNARPGDSETQSYMPLLETDLLSIMEACVDGRLDECKIDWSPGFTACINIASGGYPGSYKKGLPISGIEEAQCTPGVVVFHAGTKMQDGTLVTNGGRVLNVTAKRGTLDDAIRTAYCAVDSIHFEGMQYRKDIGAKSLAMAGL
jgi:phosphoribosylamine--glycine ligase